MLGWFFISLPFIGMFATLGYFEGWLGMAKILAFMASVTIPIIIGVNMLEDK